MSGSDETLSDSGAIDPAEVARFAALASDWWREDGPLRPLHALTQPRVTFIRDTLCARHGRNPDRPRPLEGLTLADIGCGGGLLAEPLARLGASVTGVDPAEASVQAARAHAEASGANLGITYRTGTAATLLAEGARFDAITALEVVEHVSNPDAFIKTCSDLTRPGGTLFFATVNRTAKSYALAIIGAEYILRWLDRGTHDWRRFVKPSELAALLRRHDCTPGGTSGISYDLPSRSFRLDARNVSVNYLLWASRDQS